MRGVWGLPTPHPRSKAKQREPERSKLPGGLTRPACPGEYQPDRDAFWAFLGKLKCLTRYSAADPPDSRQIHSFPREVHIDAVMSVVVFFVGGANRGPIGGTSVQGNTGWGLRDVRIPLV